MVDYAADGRALGVEIPSPDAVTLDRLNGLLAGLGQAPLADKNSDRSRPPEGGGGMMLEPGRQGHR